MRPEGASSFIDVSAEAVEVGSAAAAEAESGGCRRFGVLCGVWARMELMNDVRRGSARDRVRRRCRWSTLKWYTWFL